MSPRARTLLGAWSPPGAWAVLVFVLSCLPVRTDRIVDLPHADKAAHLVEYGVLGLLTARALGRTRPAWGGARVVLAAAVLGAAYGLTDEVHQRFTPQRAFEWGDLAADATGALAGAALLVALRAAVSGSRGSPSPPTSSPPGR